MTNIPLCRHIAGQLSLDMAGEYILDDNYVAFAGVVCTTDPEEDETGADFQLSVNGKNFLVRVTEAPDEALM